MQWSASCSRSTNCQHLPASLLPLPSFPPLLSTPQVQSIADKLGVSKFQAAAGIIDIVNENMVGAIRKVSNTRIKEQTKR